MTTINYHAETLSADHCSEELISHLIEHHGSLEKAVEAFDAIYNSPMLIDYFEKFLNHELRQELIDTQAKITLLSAEEIMEVSNYHPEAHFALAGACVKDMKGDTIILLSLDAVQDNPTILLNEVVRHEMVHYYQMESNRLGVSAEETQKVLWDNKDQTASLADPKHLSKLVVGDVMSFIEQQTTFPWELEAYGAAYDYMIEDIHKGTIQFYEENQKRLSAIHDNWLDRVIAGDITPGILPKAA